MRIGIFGDTTGRPVDDVIAQVRAAHDDGFPSFWAPQIFGLDALTTLAVAGREVPSIELGTAVVPTFPRHAMTLAQQALTVQAITGNRLVLGIGLSHQVVVEGMWGLSFDEPVRHMREYLEIVTLDREHGIRVVRRRDDARARRDPGSGRRSGADHGRGARDPDAPARAAASRTGRSPG